MARSPLFCGKKWHERRFFLPLLTNSNLQVRTYSYLLVFAQIESFVL